MLNFSLKIIFFIKKVYFYYKNFGLWETIKKIFIRLNHNYLFFYATFKKTIFFIKKYGFRFTFHLIKNSFHKIDYFYINDKEIANINKNILIEHTFQKDLTMRKLSLVIHLHVYYIDILPEIIFYLERQNYKSYHLIITTNKKSYVYVHNFLRNSKIKSFEVIEIENLGRDIYPMYLIKDKLRKFDLVLHIHTKKSIYERNFFGWRTNILQIILGSKFSISNSMRYFKNNPKLGILVPYPFNKVISRLTLAGNFFYISYILKLIHSSFLRFRIFFNRNKFPASSMFWFRPDALRYFFNLDLDNSDFRDSDHLPDGSLAHAVERLFFYFSHLSKLNYKYLLPVNYLPSESSFLFNNDIADRILFELKSSLTPIFFTHGIGGGSEFFLKNILKNSRRYLVCYKSNNYVFINLVSEKTEFTFYVRNFQDLYKVFRLINISSITLNSVFGFNINDIVKFTKYFKKNNVQLIYNMHDYYPTCPTVHLINKNNKFCNIPKSSECNNCFNYLSERNFIISYGNRSIQEWRVKFYKLFHLVDIINLYDPSAKIILDKVFNSNISNKYKLIRQNPLYLKNFKPIEPVKNNRFKIASIGLIDHKKGADVITQIANNLDRNTYEYHLIGKALVPLSNCINIHGSYEVDLLPSIVKDLSINLIFFSSIVPETYSYVISEAMALDLPILAFDIGAQGRRLKRYKKGYCVPINSSITDIISKIDLIRNELK